ncbi:MAG TPA: hypothetical protein VIY48_08645 [Candidatus Paceibacterota bacterium]
MNTRFRTNWRGKIILQIEEVIKWEAFRDEDGEKIPAGSRVGWRDAKLSDFPKGLTL